MKEIAPNLHRLHCMMMSLNIGKELNIYLQRELIRVAEILHRQVRPLQGDNVGD